MNWSKALSDCSKALPTGSKTPQTPQTPLTGPHTPSIRTIAKDGRTEFLPILQDFVPYRGRCPATIDVAIKKTINETVEQGKGTGDHMTSPGAY